MSQRIRGVAPGWCRGLAVLVLAFLAGSCAYSVDLTTSRTLARSTFVYASDGSLVTTLHAEEDREPVTLDEMADVLVEAVVAVEDDRFFEHAGVDVVATMRALVRNAQAGQVAQGGSTITQQYVKNTLLANDRTVARKVKEASLAYQVEKQYSKEEILERYLNTVYFGLGAYGAQAAAERFFDKDAADLDLAEAALLAGMIRAPEHYDPLEDPDAARARRAHVLDRMLAEGYIDAGQRAEAADAPVEVRPLETRYPAGHFVEAVKRLILSDDTFGATRDDRRKLLFTGGLRIHTTLDLGVQQAAEQAVAEVMAESTGPIAALVSVDPASGAVRALWGGHDFFSGTPKAKFDFATVGRRQAGSAFKPFALVTALQQGIGPDERFRAPREIEIEMPGGQEPWEVENYGGQGFGVLRLAQATISSVNTVYAQLIMEVGADRAVQTAATMGIRSPLRPLPSAVLGTNEVTPLDMASAYATLAADGLHARPTVIERVETADGEVLWEHDPRPERVLTPTVARNVTEVLTSVVESGTGRAAQLDRPAAGKTGTAQEWRDAWFVGYTPQLSTAVWVGFPDHPRPMVPPATARRITGGSWPASIWRNFMASAHEGQPVVPFPPAPVFESTRELDDPTTTTRRRRTAAPPTTTTTIAPTTTAPPPPEPPPETTEPPPETTTSSPTTTIAPTTTEPPPETTTSSTTTTTAPPTTSSSTTTTTSSSNGSGGGDSTET